MLINIIFISKQTKIADFHTLYIMRCRHPKETATLKKKSKRHTDGIPHPSPSPRRAIQTSSAIRRPNKFRSGHPSKKTGRHRRSPLHKLSNATSFACKRNTFAAPLLAQAARRQLPQRNPTVQTASRHPNLGHPPDSKPP